MDSLFNEMSLLYNKNLVGVTNRGKSVGNHNHCFVFNQFLKSFLY